MKKWLIVLLLTVAVILVGISGCILKDSYEKRILAKDYPEISNDRYTQKPLNLSLEESRIKWRKECNGQPGEYISFYSHNPNPFVVGGGWVEKSVVDCDDYYLIEEMHDWGPTYYGPFNKSNLNETDLEIKCLDVGGEWTEAYAGYFCNMPTSDAGKNCTDRSQCEGRCIPHSMNATTGECSSLHSSISCTPELVNGHVVEICID